MIENNQKFILDFGYNSELQLVGTRIIIFLIIVDWFI